MARLSLSGRSKLLGVMITAAGCADPRSASQPEPRSAPAGAKTPVLSESVSLRPAPAIGPMQTKAATTGARSRVLWADPAVQVDTRAGVSVDTARNYLQAYAPRLGLAADGLNNAVALVHHRIRGGAGLVTFGQRIGDIEVYGSRLGVLMDPSGSLTAISGELFPEAGKAPAGRFELSARQAIEGVLRGHLGSRARTLQLRSAGRSAGGYESFSVSVDSDLAAFDGPARAKPVYYRDGKFLVPAYYTEFIGKQGPSTTNEGVATLVSALDGRTLHEYSLTAREAHTYRVWAEEGGIPTDGPTADHSPHPTGEPDGSAPDYVEPILVEMDGFNNSMTSGVPDPWLDGSSNETRGNNVDAYSDRDQQVDPETGALINDGYNNGDLRATATEAKTFDRVFDVAKDPGEDDEQIMAAVTQLFYVNNWLHDYWYDSGFDEVSGNAQYFNYGRGGAQNDALRAEAQDSADAGFRNNANMSTPADGLAPRMQMYLWSNRDVERSLTMDPSPDGYVGDTGYALFGPSTFDLTAEAILANDGTEPVTDGCEEPEDDIAGKILVVEAGGTDDMPPACRSVDRAALAEAAGAVGLIYVGDSEAVPTLGSDPNIPITIPGLALSKPDGDLLIAQIADDETTSVTMTRESRPDLDGTIDNQIVAHEWGHYLHHRLVLCGGHSCGGMSEGWADYVALHMTAREDDDAEGLYSIAGYASASYSENNHYFGIRRYPYTTDMSKNPLTFKHIKNSESLPEDIAMQPAAPDNAQVHNVGEVWASMLHEGHMNLLAASRGPDARMTWEEAHRRMADYLVAGMKLTPVEPSFVEQRDAILAAAAAINPDDMLALAEGFAKRGLGSCAVAPPPTSLDNEEAVESMDLKGNMQFRAWGLVDAVESCDDDGVLDINEQGLLLMLVANTGAVPLEAMTATVTSTSDALVLGATPIEIPSLAPHTETIVPVPATIAPDTTEVELLPIEITLADPDACTPELKTTLIARANVDEVEQSSASDDVEAHNSALTVAQNDGHPAPLWGRVRFGGDHPPHDESQHMWWGQDAATISDTTLTTPALELTGTEPFVFEFSHLHSFESGPAEPEGPDVHWDGAVLEISTNGGLTWEDVSTYVDPGYGGTIGEYPNLPNPLAGREGFVGASAGAPTWTLEPLTLDFGTELEDKTVHLRFRIGTDAAVGALGWLIDDIKVTGISNTPFTSVVPDDGDCDDDDDDDTGSGTGDTGGNTGTEPATGDTGMEPATGAGDDDDDDDPPAGSGGDDEGCGCASTGAAAPVSWAAWLGVLVLGAAGRRRQRQRSRID
ncbi:MAG: peptidase [Myxococcales bacterium FL481]|nr:MAG: peptidase [Myxococcales bacterium FL481]